jgi:gliding motility-associated-like protein
MGTIPAMAVTVPQYVQLSLVTQGTCSAIINKKDTIRSKPLPAAPVVTNNGPVCAASDAIFSITGQAGSQVSYTINAGPVQQITIPAAGTAQVIIPSVNNLQILALTNIHSTSNCDLPLNLGSSVSILPLVSSIVDISICEGLNYMGYTQSGVYTDTFPSAQGCDSVRTLNLSVIRTTKPKLGPDRVICPGDTIVLDPGTFSTYLWQDGSVSPVYTVTAPGTYSVSVNATCGLLKDEVIVSNGICDIYFPTGFSPNKDGRNDQFKVLTDLTLSSYDLKVYDRWGGLIFHTTDQSKGWDGTFKGTALNSGIFIWLSSYSYKGQSKFEKGTVMLVR